MRARPAVLAAILLAVALLGALRRVRPGPADATSTTGDASRGQDAPGLGGRGERPASPASESEADAPPTEPAPRRLRGPFRVRGRLLAPPDASLEGASVRVIEERPPPGDGWPGRTPPEEESERMPVGPTGAFEVPAAQDGHEVSGVRVVASVPGFADVGVTGSSLVDGVVEVEIPLSATDDGEERVTYAARIVDGRGRPVPDLVVDVEQDLRYGPIGGCRGDSWARSSVVVLRTGRARSDAEGRVGMRGICRYADVGLRSTSPERLLLQAARRWRRGRDEDVWTAWPVARLALEVVGEGSEPRVDEFGLSLTAEGAPDTTRVGREGRLETTIPFSTTADEMAVDVTVTADGFRPATLSLRVPRAEPSVRARIPLRESPPAERGRLVVHVLGGGPDVFGSFKGSNYVRGTLRAPGHRSIAQEIWEPVTSRDQRVEAAWTWPGVWEVRLEPAYEPHLGVTRTVRVEAGRDAEIEWTIPPMGTVRFPGTASAPAKEATGVVFRPVDGGEELRFRATYVSIVPTGTWDVANTYDDGTTGPPVRVTVEADRETPVEWKD